MTAADWMVRVGSLAIVGMLGLSIAAGLVLFGFALIVSIHDSTRDRDWEGIVFYGGVTLMVLAIGVFTLGVLLGGKS